MRDCVVLGCGRSGTSMTAGILAAAGYHPGRRLIPADGGNPGGYFEDVVVNALNDELLALAVERDLLPHPLGQGKRWLAALPVEAPVQPTAAQQARMAATLHGPRPWCRKDPQFCYTLPAWRPLLGDAVFLCVFREPSRTAASLLTHLQQRHPQLSFDQALQLWTAYYQHVLARHRFHGDWVFCHYQQLLDGTALTTLEQALHISLPTDIVDATLSRSPTPTVTLPAETAACYRQLCVLAGMPTTDSTPTTTDSS